MTTETTILTRGIGATHATFNVSTPAGIWSISFDRAGAVSVNNAPGGVGKSSAATAGGIAKRNGLRAEAVALFAEFDADQESMKKYARGIAAEEAALAKKATAPAKAAKVNDGFDTALAKRAGIPNLAGWSQDGGALRFCGWTIFAHLDGFAWAAAGKVHLTSAKRPFRSALDACRSAQAAQFPDWKKGSFENFIAAAA